MSTRSSSWPIRRNSQASSRVIEESTSPFTTAQRSLANWKAPCIRDGRTPRGRPSEVVFSDSHTSVESASRTPRAFSRAVSNAPATDEGFMRSVTRRSSTRCTVQSSRGT